MSKVAHSRQPHGWHHCGTTIMAVKSVAFCGSRLPLFRPCLPPLLSRPFIPTLKGRHHLLDGSTFLRLLLTHRRQTHPVNNSIRFLSSFPAVSSKNKCLKIKTPEHLQFPNCLRLSAIVLRHRKQSDNRLKRSTARVPQATTLRGGSRPTSR